MRIAFNPSTVAALIAPPNNKDITFDLRGQNIFARGVKFCGTDTNTWRDIKINNVSIDSNTLDLRDSSTTTLTNINGVVTINSTWRPVVDNLTSDSTTSSLSANLGRVLKALIDGKSDSDHNHDGRYVRYYAVTTLDCNNLAVGLTAAGVSATNAAHTNHSAFLYISDVGTPFQIQIPDSSVPYIYKRYYSSGTWSEWFKLNAGYADSAGSATKLQTPRTIWGQSFDGTGDVNGTIYINNSDSSNGAIRLNNDRNSNARISAIGDQVIFNTGNAIRFGGTSWDWNVWAGLKYNSSNKTIYLGLADNSIFNANSALSGGTLNLRAGISNINLNSGTSIRGLPTNGSPYSSSITLRDTSISLSAYGDISMSTGPGAIELTSGYSGIKLSCLGNNASVDSGGFKVEASRGAYLNSGNSGNVYLCLGGGNVGIGYNSPSYKLDVNGLMRASGFHHGSANSDNYILLAGGGYKSLGGDYDNPIFLGYLNLDHGNDGTISSSFYCLGYSVSFTYTRGGNYCKISIPDTSYQVFYIKAAIASVNYSGGGMDTWTGNRRGEGAWWLHCYAYNSNEVRVKGFHNSNENNDSWWGGNPLYSGSGSANVITVCLFGYVTFR